MATFSHLPAKHLFSISNALWVKQLPVGYIVYIMLLSYAWTHFIMCLYFVYFGNIMNKKEHGPLCLNNTMHEKEPALLPME